MNSADSLLPECQAASSRADQHSESLDAPVSLHQLTENSPADGLLADDLPQSGLTTFLNRIAEAAERAAVANERIAAAVEQVAAIVPSLGSRMSRDTRHIAA